MPYATVDTLDNALNRPALVPDYASRVSMIMPTDSRQCRNRMTRYAGIPSHESCNLLLMTYSPMLSLYLCICVFVYLSICVFVYLHMHCYESCNLLRLTYFPMFCKFPIGKKNNQKSKRLPMNRRNSFAAKINEPLRCWGVRSCRNVNIGKPKDFK